MDFNISSSTIRFWAVVEFVFEDRTAGVWRELVNHEFLNPVLKAGHPDRCLIHLSTC